MCDDPKAAFDQLGRLQPDWRRDDTDRRPSHANRRKALRQHILQNEFSTITAAWRLPQKILQLIRLFDFALATSQPVWQEPEFGQLVCPHNAWSPRILAYQTGSPVGQANRGRSKTVGLLLRVGQDNTFHLTDNHRVVEYAD